MDDGIRVEEKVKCPLDGFVMELLAVGDGCGYWCPMCENCYDEDPPHAELTETSGVQP